MRVIPHRRDAETRRNITKTQGDRRGGRGNRRFPGYLRSAACILCVCLRETPVTSAPSAISGFDFVFSSAPLRLCGDSGVLRLGCGSAAVSLCGENLRDAPPQADFRIPSAAARPMRMQSGMPIPVYGRNWPAYWSCRAVGRAEAWLRSRLHGVCTFSDGARLEMSAM